MSNSARRAPLRDLRIQDTTHAGLWLDAFLRFQTDVPGGNNEADEVKRARSELIQEVAKRQCPQGYKDAAEARMDSLREPPDGVLREVRFFTAPGRLIVGLGQKGVIEAGITLERTWGVPYLPGSSLKGVAAAAAHLLTDHDAWHKASDGGTPGESFAQLFGTTEQRGKVIFHDAWWLPNLERQKPLAHDIMTVHHPNYYQRSVDDRDFIPPDGTDSPNPISFITTSQSLCFAVALEAAPEDSAWYDAAWQLLTMGLEELGIGAKTNAGYGRLFEDAERTQRLRDADQAKRDIARQLKAFRLGSLSTQFTQLLDEFDNSPSLDTYQALKEVADQPEDARNPFSAFTQSRYHQYFPDPLPADAFDTFADVLKTHDTWGPALLRGTKPASLNVGSQKLKDLGAALGLTGTDEPSPNQHLIDLSADRSTWFTAAEQAVALGDALLPKEAKQIVDNAGNTKKWKKNSDKFSFYVALKERAKKE